jgi:hypothetical protein
MKRATEGTHEDSIKHENALIENFKLALIESWDELERDEENDYNYEITFGLGRVRMSDGKIGEYQLTLQLKTEKFVEDEERIEGYLND